MESLQVLNRLKVAGRWSVSKLWQLVKYAVTNPIGFMWACLKAYLVVLVWVLILAFTFGAQAQTTEPTSVGPQVVDVTICEGYAPTGTAPQFSLPGKKDVADCAIGSRERYAGTRLNKLNEGRECPSKQVAAAGGSIQVQDYQGSPTCFMSGSPYWVPIPYRFIKHSTDYQCPPDNPLYSAYKKLETTPEGTKQCIKPVSGCWSGADAPAAPLMQFSPNNAGQSQICVVGDNGKKCPWKAKGSNGIFEPDVGNPNSCLDEPPPPDANPNTPDTCVTGGNGMKVCPDDPNSACKPDPTNAGVMTCKAGCGYINGKFFCTTEPDIPNLPDLPDAPDPNDEIPDPNKAMADMLKKDFKDVQIGVESRLDGLTQLMANQNQLSKQEIDSQKKSNDFSNQLLNSINQNTANTVAELKKMNEGDGGPSPTPSDKEIDLGEKNDWSTRNFGTVIKGAGDTIMQQPVFNSVGNFFTASFGGSCPSWSVNVWGFAIVIDQLCSETFQQILPAVRAVILLVFSFFAFRVAFLD
jgi:hypothetical protein